MLAKMALFQEFLKITIISLFEQVNDKSLPAFEIEDWINFLPMHWTVKRKWLSAHSIHSLRSLFYGD